MSDVRAGSSGVKWHVTEDMVIANVTRRFGIGRGLGNNVGNRDGVRRNFNSAIGVIGTLVGFIAGGGRSTAGTSRIIIISTIGQGRTVMIVMVMLVTSVIGLVVIERLPPFPELLFLG